MKTLFATLLAAILTACGGGADAAPCAVPHEIAVTRGWSGDVQQYRKATAASPYVLHATGTAAFDAVMPCAGSGGAQYLHFKTWGEGFFSPAHGLPGNGNHLAALTRGTFDLSVPRYAARGVIAHRDFGITGERYHRDDATGATNVLQCAPWVNGGSCPQGVYVPPHPVTVDDGVFHWEMESTPTHTAYNVFKASTGQNAVSVWGENYDQIYLTGSEVAFAVLCEAGCPGPFIVRFFDISAGWK